MDLDPPVPLDSLQILKPTTKLSVTPPSPHAIQPFLTVPITSSTTVTRPTPATYSPTHLLILDPNPLPSTSESTLHSTARDAAQSLLSHLLTTCPISTTSTGLTLTLTPADPPLIQLPREKRLPAAKAQTAWDKFAAKKGIRKKRRGETGEGGRANMVFDEATKEWRPKWGYKGKNKDAEGQWLVEVDDRDVDRMDGGRRRPREERKEGVRRNERRMKANERRSKK
ncbi:MAG: Rhodanese- sulfurtransferase [Vezdaea aestivalis]|nr:MAG: Rhodanese- sulfurtransferase [Vezdaea aestivalis]